MNKLYIHPLPVRIWHWTNALGFVLLIATGLQIRYLDLIQLVSFRTAVVVHNWIGFVLIANFFIWLGFYLFSDKIKVYLPELSPTKYFRASFRQLLRPTAVALWFGRSAGSSPGLEANRHGVPIHGVRHVLPTSATAVMIVSYIVSLPCVKWVVLSRGALFSRF